MLSKQIRLLLALPVSTAAGPLCFLSFLLRSLSLRGRGRGAFKALQSPACFVSLRSVPLRRAPHLRRRRPCTARPGPRPPPRPRAGPAPRVAPLGAGGGGAPRGKAVRAAVRRGDGCRAWLRSVRGAQVRAGAHLCFRVVRWEGSHELGARQGSAMRRWEKAVRESSVLCSPAPECWNF